MENLEINLELLEIFFHEIRKFKWNFIKKNFAKKVPFILNYHKYVSLHLCIQYSQQNVEHAAHIF